MRAYLLLLAPLVLAACDNREPVSICAVVGDPDEQLTSAYHDVDGLRAVLLSDASANQSQIVRDVSAAPILSDLWRGAENTMRALPSAEPSPCGGATLSAVTVRFNDGSTVTRVTTCVGNALSRVADGVLAAAEADTAAEREPEDAGPAVVTLQDACDRLS